MTQNIVTNTKKYTRKAEKKTRTTGQTHKADNNTLLLLLAISRVKQYIQHTQCNIYDRYIVEK